MSPDTPTAFRCVKRLRVPLHTHTDAPMSISCCCSMDLVFPGRLLERLIIGPAIGLARPIPGCPGLTAGPPAGLVMPQSPGPATGGRC